MCVCVSLFLCLSLSLSLSASVCVVSLSLSLSLSVSCLSVSLRHEVTFGVHRALHIKKQNKKTTTNCISLELPFIVVADTSIKGHSEGGNN